MLPFLALLGLTLLWLLLPLLPALRELARPTDVAPLKVVDRSSGYVAYFARNFRQYLDRQMAAKGSSPPSSSSRPNSTKAPRQKPRRASYRSGERTGTTSRLYSPGGPPPAWQPGHQYAVRFSSPCPRDRIGVPQRGQGRPGRR
jgi:hypothetical protein